MNTSGNDEASQQPIVEPDLEATYTIDVVARITGISSQTILHFQEQGLISPVPEGESEPAHFDDDTLRKLRRMEHLRTQCGLNGPALTLMLRLLDEVERLGAELRSRR